MHIFNDFLEQNAYFGKFLSFLHVLALFRAYKSDPYLSKIKMVLF
jgi:hypothetical protein